MLFYLFEKKKQTKQLAKEKLMKKGATSTDVYRSSTHINVIIAQTTTAKRCYINKVVNSNCLKAINSVQ